MHWEDKWKSAIDFLLDSFEKEREDEAKRKQEIMIQRKTKEKTIKKRQIIRESEYKTLPKRITEQYNITFTPFTKTYFERRAAFFYLKGKKYLGDQYSHHEYPKEMLSKLTGVHMWDRRYRGWLIKYNQEGEMTIKASLRQPESRVGLAIFRKKR